MLERRHEVLAPTLAGHAGGPPLNGTLSDATLADAVERAMDDAGFGTAHLVGNSLGGYVAFQLAARGRARSVVALAPAGGWASGDRSYRDTLRHFPMLQAMVRESLPHADRIVATAEGRRRATMFITSKYEHIPAELIVHMMRGVATCAAVRPLVGLARREGWRVEAERVTCPVRIVWGTEDKLLPWPSAAERFRTDWLPTAEFVELDGIGHAPQLDSPLETAELILGFTSTR
jgi:pimeloyl-ACP methyl ester carboxylesterase